MLICPTHTFDLTLIRSLAVHRSSCPADPLPSFFTGLPIQSNPREYLSPVVSPSPTSSPKSVPTTCESASPICQNQQNKNPVIASLIYSTRPLSAYGTCFDGARVGRETLKSLDRPISSSADTCGSPIRHMSEDSTFGEYLVWSLVKCVYAK